MCGRTPPAAELFTETALSRSTMQSCLEPQSPFSVFARLTRGCSGPLCDEPRETSTQASQREEHMMIVPRFVERIPHGGTAKKSRNMSAGLWR